MTERRGRTRSSGLAERVGPTSDHHHLGACSNALVKIDHILVSNEVEEHLVYGSAAVYRPATNETAYAGVVSDHWPVIARFRPRD